MKVNGKDFEISTNTKFLVRDTYLELSEHPIQIGFQTELGVAPTMQPANALYYSWNPGTLMTIVVGTNFEIYWFNSISQTVETFKDTDIKAINQNLVKEFRYQGTEVVFEGKKQSFSILAPSENTTVDPSERFELVKYKFMDFDSDTLFVLPEFYDQLSVIKSMHIQIPNPTVGFVFGTKLTGYEHCLTMNTVAPTSSIAVYSNTMKSVSKNATKNYRTNTYSDITLSEIDSWESGHFNRDIKSLDGKQVSDGHWTTLFDNKTSSVKNDISRYDIERGSVELTPMVIGGRLNEGTPSYGKFSLKGLSIKGIKPDPDFVQGNHKEWLKPIKAEYTPATFNNQVCLLEKIRLANGTYATNIIYPTSGNPVVHN